MDKQEIRTPLDWEGRIWLVGRSKDADVEALWIRTRAFTAEDAAANVARTLFPARKWGAASAGRGVFELTTLSRNGQINTGTFVRVRRITIETVDAAAGGGKEA